MLRKKGHSIKQLASMFHRSTSFIFRILKVNGLAGMSWVGSGWAIGKALNKFDLRKSPGHAALWGYKKGLNPWEILRGWLQFAKGKIDKPP